MYTFHPKHMDVRYPKNADDELITESSEGPDLPLSTPTTMSVYIHRLKLADLCREIVDTMPSVPEESRGPPDYGVILALDTKLRDYLDNLPVFFQMDPASIQQSEHICKERPYIPYQRITMHFSVHARICRLHRPYHLEGSTNSKFAYSRTACIRSAHRTLELRRIMDEQGTSSSFRPERFWVIMQHVFMAALTLATDVSFNPEAPDAEARKEKVMAAYRTFERSQKESSFLVEGIQRNMQALIDTLQKKRGRVPSPHPGEPAAMSSQVPTTRPVVPSESNTLQGPQDMAVAGDVDASFSCQTPQDPNSTSANDGTEIGGWPAENENWYKLWSEFLAAAPDLDATQWTSLLGDIDADFQFGMGLG